MRLKVLFAMLLACLLGGAFLPGEARPPVKTSTKPVAKVSTMQRNVLLIISDDQGLDMGAYGSKSVKTPNLDKLAATGTLFTQGYATVSSCSPSRSVIFTGLYSHTNGMYGLAHDVHNQHLLDGVQTLPALLKQHGYTTALVGKKHILPSDALPFDQELEPEQSGVRDVAAMAKAAGGFFRQTSGKPFFMAVGFSDPHRDSVNFGNSKDWPGVKTCKIDPDKVEVPAHLPNVPAVRKDLAEYYQAVNRLDTGVGLLLQELKASGHDRDTLVIFLSDNGRAFPGAKTNLYDDGIHLPLIVYDPTRPIKGKQNDGMVSWIDIVPTVLDWTETPFPQAYRLPGHSLLPLLEDEHTDDRNRVFASHSFHEINQYYPMRAVRTRQYKYILNLAPELAYPIAGDVASSPSWQGISPYGEKVGSKVQYGGKVIALNRLNVGPRTYEAYMHRPAEELYDIQADPNELRNLVTDPAFAAILGEMRQTLEDWRRESGDPWLEGNTSPFHHSGH